MSEQIRILVVDDEANIADLVVHILNKEGFEAVAYYSSQEALKAFREGDFDLAILDVMMPVMDGYELCVKIRAQSEIPVLFLSAKAEEYDQVVGFTLGADDYIPKPFKPRELVARVRARLRRRNYSKTERAHFIQCGDIVIDSDHHLAMLFDKPLELTPTEFSILLMLARKPGKPLASRSIFEEVWHEPADASSVHAVMVHIHNLRSKLAEIDSTKTYIENTWGVGYSLRERP